MQDWRERFYDKFVMQMPLAKVTDALDFITELLAERDNEWRLRSEAGEKLRRSILVDCSDFPLSKRCEQCTAVAAYDAMVKGVESKGG
jgi:hypothetical protein